MATFASLLEDFFYRPDEDEGPLFALASGPDEAPPLVAEEVPGEYLAFSLEDECYAVPIGELREIVKVPPLTELPRAAPSLLGVMNLRGEVLPVYDIKPRLRLSVAAVRIAGPDPAPLPKAARVLIIRAEGGDAGVLVDAVREVVKMKPSALEPPPPGVGGGERDCVMGLGRRRDQLYILLDIHQALA
ncbi:MAG: chemotaxis protein CheW [Myxococcaceae bacterium]